MLFTGWEVRIRKNCAQGLEAEGTVFPHKDRPKLVNNIYIFFCLDERELSLQSLSSRA